MAVVQRLRHPALLAAFWDLTQGRTISGHPSKSSCLQLSLCCKEVYHSLMMEEAEAGKGGVSAASRWKARDLLFQRTLSCCHTLLCDWTKIRSYLTKKQLIPGLSVMFLTPSTPSVWHWAPPSTRHVTEDDKAWLQLLVIHGWLQVGSLLPRATELGEYHFLP